MLRMPDVIPVTVRSHLPKRLAGVWIARIGPPIGLAVDSWSLLGYELAREELLLWLDEHLDAAVDAAAGCVTRRGATDLARDERGRLTMIRVGGARYAVAYLEGHVGCTEEFEQIPQVLNGASELVNEVFGERGRHARTALGHMVMPLRSPVMVGSTTFGSFAT